MRDPEKRTGSRQQRKNWMTRKVAPWKARKLYRCIIRRLTALSKSMMVQGAAFGTDDRHVVHYATATALGQMLASLHKTPPAALQNALNKLYEFPLTERQREEIVDHISVMYREMGRILAANTQDEATHVAHTDGPEAGLEFTDYEPDRGQSDDDASLQRGGPPEGNHPPV